jgi:hypothetical protein
MKKHFKPLILSLALAGALTACADSKDSKAKSDTGPTTVSAKSSMDASELADAGEQLVTPYTFMLADKVFAMALKNDPMNKKALMYKALLKPLMLYKGIGNRIKPLIRSYGSIGNLETSLEKIPKSPLRNFLLDGPEDIKSAKQVQDLLISQREAFDEIRIFFKTSTESEVTINMNPYLFGSTILENWSKSCRVIEDGPNGVIVTCDSQDVAIVKMGVGDAVAASQAFAGYVLLFDIYTAYSVEGIETVFKRLENPALTSQQRQNILESVPTLGKLRADNKLARVLNLGADFGGAVKWALKYQKELCPLGFGHENRPGYIIKGGICIQSSDQLTQNLKLLEQGLGGAINLTVETAQGVTKETTVNLAKFVQQPPSDLRTIAPASYCPMGQIPRALRDSTLGGLYPKGDANEISLAPCVTEFGQPNE